MRYLKVYLLLVTIVFMTVAFKAGSTSGVSMEPFLMNGQKFLYVHPIKPPRVGEIVILEKDNEQLVKRVVGTPGDTIMLLNGKVIGVNGSLLPEATLPKASIRNVKLHFVSAGHYYVIGDNQDYSIDSREFGEVTKTEIHGFVVLRLW